MNKVWTLAQLEKAKLIQLGRGKIISRKDLKNTPGEYPVYSSSSVGDGKLGEYEKFMFDEELITWSVDGGGTLFYRKKHRFSITNVTGFLRILDASIINYQYLFYVLTSLHSKIKFDWVKKAHPSVLREKYNAIPLPSLEEQKHIKNKLDIAFDEIDRINSNSENKIKSQEVIFQNYFKELFAQLKQTETSVKLSKICNEICAGGDVPKKNFSKYKTDKFHIPIIANAVKKNGLYGYTNQAKINKPSITIAARGSGTGHTEIRYEPFFPIVRLIVLTPKINVIELEYLKYSIQSLNILISGSAIPQLTLPMIKNYSIPLPSINRQKNFIFKLDSISNGIKKLNTIQYKKMNLIGRLKKSILQQTFNGKIVKK